MALTSRPLWLQGMFMRPQHFQQHDRYLEDLLEQRVAGLRGDGWGVRELAIDQQLLALGKLAVVRCTAVMPDGTPIAIPDQVEAAPVREIPAGTLDRVVKLAMPVRLRDALEAEAGDEGRAVRFRVRDETVRDSTTGAGEPATIKVGLPKLSLLLDGEPEEDLICLPIARIRQVEPTGAVRLAEGFMPPALDALALPRLAEILHEIQGLLHNRGEALAARIDPSRSGGDVAGLVDLLMLQTMNRYEPLFAHFAQTPGIHPEVVMRSALQLAGELATFARATRRPPALPPYRHVDLESCFGPVLDAIRQALSTVLDQAAVALPLHQGKYGVWVSPIADRTLLAGSRFVLAVSTSAQPELVRSQFPTQAKAGPLETIRDLVNLQLPGLPVRPLPVAPREIPYRTGTVYFELGQEVELWKRLAGSAAFAFHISGDYPELAMEFWAIRENRP